MKYTGLVFTALMMCYSISIFSQQIKVIAHRGYWKAEGATQNSICSLKEAQTINCYGSEFDVWITSDTVAVVTHDSKVNGMVIEETIYDRVKKIRLSNGETIPLLKDYLSAGKKGNTHFILELKTRCMPEFELALAKEVVKQVTEAGLASKTEYITFSKNIVCEIVHLQPKAKIAYVAGLKTALEPQNLNEFGCNGIDYHYSVYQKHPQWIKEAHKLGMEVNVWTVNTEELMLEMIEAGVDCITTDEPELLQQVLKEYTK